MVSYIAQKGGPKNVPWGPLDIEDLTALGKKQYFCPYYQQSDRVEYADIVFMPYNYMMEPTTR